MNVASQTRAKCCPELTIHLGEGGQSNFCNLEIEWYDRSQTKRTRRMTIEIVSGVEDRELKVTESGDGIPSSAGESKVAR